MPSPTDLRYTRSHEWARIDGDVATCGVTAFAQESLGDVVHVELPEVGASVVAGQAAAEIESVKAVSDIYSPVTGEVIEVNAAIDDGPEVVNSDCYGDGWLFRVRLSGKGAGGDLLDASAYDEHVAASGH